MNRKGEMFEAIMRRKAVIGVIGLGYVGLPLALAFVERGFPVIGFDTDARKTAALSEGRCYVQHIPAARVQAAMATGRLRVSPSFEPLAECLATIICVPTPLTETRDPDLSFVMATVERIKETLRPGQLVVLESTTYPGTTSGPVMEALQATGLVPGEDFFVAFSPEREDPGNTQHSTVTIPKVVGGCGQDAGDLAENLYAQVIDKVVRVSDASTAEAVKITENVFRAVNIALVNELKIVYEKMDIDIWEVLDAASTKPFGFMRFNPGPGWGGHCIPLDPFYLSWKAREHGVDTRFIELAGEVNRAMPAYVISRTQDALNQHAKAVRGSKIMLLGLAYKRDVGDMRESPAVPIAQGLLGLGAMLSYHDPYVRELPETRMWHDRPSLRSVELTSASVAEQDAIVVVTDHRNVDYDLVQRHAKLIVDARGVFARGLPNVVKA